MKIAYIAGPYRAESIHGVVENIRKAEKVAIKYWKMGFAVICPHKNSSLLDGLCPDETWLDGDIEIMKRCDFVVMLPGWGNSNGSKTEHKIASELGMEIIYEI